MLPYNRVEGRVEADDEWQLMLVNQRFVLGDLTSDAFVSPLCVVRFPRHPHRCARGCRGLLSFGVRGFGAMEVHDIGEERAEGVVPGACPVRRSPRLSPILDYAPTLFVGDDV